MLDFCMSVMRAVSCVRLGLCSAEVMAATVDL